MTEQPDDDDDDFDVIEEGTSSPYDDDAEGVQDEEGDADA